ncbi:hypothetical protein ACFQ9H_06160 [Streptomyces sp. NPDC056517]|uniref:hypothetical protein n=1 Tax=Streptomyces sp. NPDC056517 TaxID=3345848 RepID=UPI0036A171FA
MGQRGDYLIQHEHGDPIDKVPELSRRGRAFTVWAALRSLGRSGVSDLVERLCRHASAFAAGITGIDGATVLNEVAFTQVCAEFGSDGRTDRVLARLLDDGTAWISGSTWHGTRHADLGEQLVDHRRRCDAHARRDPARGRQGLTTVEPPDVSLVFARHTSGAPSSVVESAEVGRPGYRRLSVSAPAQAQEQQ